MKVMGISGLPGSGKSLVDEVAIEKGAIIVSMGDIIREEAKKRNEPTKETAVNLRKEFGNNIVSELTIKKIKKLQEEQPDKLFIIEGIRRKPLKKEIEQTINTVGLMILMALMLLITVKDIFNLF